jgi:hypothetical protein
MFQLLGDLFGAMFNILGGIAALILLVLGALTLFYGRKLFWIFAALVGFIFGLMVASQLALNVTDFIRIMIAIGVGVLCGIVAVYAEKLMILLVGFLGFGILGYLLINLFDFSPSINWVVFLVTGSLGAVYITRHLEWIIIIISTLIGAIMVSMGMGKFIQINFLVDLLIFIALFAAGIFFQKKALSGKN